MQDFQYKRAYSTSEMISQFSSDQDGIRILAGGTDLIVQLREGRRKARLLVANKTVPEANLLAYGPGSGLTLGAAVPCDRLRQDALIARLFPGLIDAVELIGGVQIQGRVTLGEDCNDRVRHNPELTWKQCKTGKGEAIKLDAEQRRFWGIFRARLRLSVSESVSPEPA